MAELMEERAYLVVGKECGLVSSRTGEIHHIHDMRSVIFLAIDELRLEVVHPCTATLAVPRMEICIIYGQELTFLVKHLVCRHFGVIDLDVLVLLECYAIQPLGQTEHALLNCLKLKVRTNDIVADGVLVVLEFLGVVTEIPRLKSRIEALLIGKLLQLLHLLACGGHVIVAQLIKQTIHILLVLSHILVQRLVGKAVLFEQLCQRQTRIGDIDDILRIVELATYTTRVIGHV